MRGGFLLGTVVGAAAAAVWMSRRNNNMNFTRMGNMVSSAIGDGFKMMGTNSKADASASSSQSKQAASNTNNKNNTNSKADQQQLQQLIAKDADVQKEVKNIMSHNTH